MSDPVKMIRQILIGDAGLRSLLVETGSGAWPVFGGILPEHYNPTSLTDGENGTGPAIVISVKGGSTNPEIPLQSVSVQVASWCGVNEFAQAAAVYDAVFDALHGQQNLDFGDDGRLLSCVEESVAQSLVDPDAGWTMRVGSFMCMVTGGVSLTASVVNNQTVKQYVDSSIAAAIEDMATLPISESEVTGLAADLAAKATSASVSSEAAARSSADGVLAAAISTETSRAVAAEAAAIVTAEGYTDTKAATEVTNRNAAIATETSRATAAEGVIASSVTTEATARAAAVTILQAVELSRYQGLYYEPGLTLDKIIPASTAAIGNLDLYTVPANKRALLLLSCFNSGLVTAASTFTLSQKIKIAGTYYQVKPTSAALVTGALGQLPMNSGYVAEAGETFALGISQITFVLTQVSVVGGVTTYTGTITGGAANAFIGESFKIAAFGTAGNNVTITVTASTATTLVCVTSTQVNETHAGTAIDQAALNIWGIVLLFDNTSALRTTKLTSFVVGNNTLYTCPSGKTFYSSGYTALHDGNAAAQGFTYINFSGGARNVKLNLVPNGGSVSAGNLAAVTPALADKVNLSANVSYILSPGDFFNVTTDSASASQFAYATGYEK